MLLQIATAILLCASFLPSQVNGLFTVNATCLSGYDWLYSSIGQSPCDVAAELAGVCSDGEFNLNPLKPGYVYLGPIVANADICRCSSVYYSLLSACAYCQDRNYLKWSAFTTNCSTVYLTVYDQQIPPGVKVPAYAYQNVSISDTFDVTLAQSVKGVESSGLPLTTTTTALTS